jgi:hemoglobin-like flavoprotein
MPPAGRVSDRTGSSGGYGFAVTPEQIAVVERTLAEIQPVFDVMVADFYRRLFAADPSAEALFFRNEPAAQRAKLAAELDQVVRSIRRHDAFLARAKALGRQHQSYGVRPRHYASARTALMAALAGVLGERWTEQVAASWSAAYDLITEAMSAAGTEPPEVPVGRAGRRSPH